MHSSGPVIEFGELWSTWNMPMTVFIVTGNGSLNGRGEAVMGRGAALQLARMLPGVARLFGEAIAEMHQPDYHLVLLNPEKIGLRCSRPQCTVGLLQVKRYFAEPADLYLVRDSLQELAKFARRTSARVNMNYPAIGYGMLNEWLVAPLLGVLPSNVHVWRYKYEKPRGSTDDTVSDGE